MHRSWKDRLITVPNKINIFHQFFFFASVFWLTQTIFSRQLRAISLHQSSSRLNHRRQPEAAYHRDSNDRVWNFYSRIRTAYQGVRLTTSIILMNTFRFHIISTVYSILFLSTKKNPSAIHKKNKIFCSFVLIVDRVISRFIANCAHVVCKTSKTSFREEGVSHRNATIYMITDIFFLPPNSPCTHPLYELFILIACISLSPLLEDTGSATLSERYIIFPNVLIWKKIIKTSCWLSRSGGRCEAGRSREASSEARPEERKKKAARRRADGGSPDGRAGTARWKRHCA